MRIFPRLTGLWRNGDFVNLWAGSTVSQFGSWLGALSFAAVVTLGASPLQMGILGAVGVAPGVIFGFAAGVWADRMRRRPIMVIADIGRAVALASVSVAFALDVLRIEHLYVVVFVNGAFRTFFDVSSAAYLPTVLGRDNLVEANSKIAASESVVETGAFSVGGWIVQLATAMTAVIIDALSFLISALFFMAIRKPESVVTSTDKRQSPVREAWEGLGFVLGHPVLRAVTGSAVAESLVHGTVGSIVLIYGVRELGFGTGVLATIFAVGGVSSFVGATFSTRITRRFGVGPTMTAGFLLFGIGALVLALARGSLLTAGAVLVVGQLFDAAYTVYGINEVSLRQAVASDRMLGRVTATVRFVGIGVFLAASLLGGALAEVIGFRWTLVVGGGCGVLGAVWLFFSPVWGIREVPRGES